MKNYMLIPLLLGLVLASPLQASSITYSKINGGGTVAHVVTIDLTDPDVRVSVALAKGGTGKAETFKSMMKRSQPSAAITGTFFDTKTLIPTGDIAMFGRVVHSGCIGSALCIDANNKASIVPLKIGRQSKWAGYETVLCAGPTLVSGGKVAIALRHEGFRNSLMSPNRRTAVGITKSGKLLMVAVNRRASFYSVAKLMIKLNVTDALTLDGGSSTAFYCKGKFFAVPGRTLTNCLVAYSKSQDYFNAKTALAPSALLADADQTPYQRPTSGWQQVTYTDETISPALLIGYRQTEVFALPYQWKSQDTESDVTYPDDEPFTNYAIMGTQRKQDAYYN